MRCDADAGMRVRRGAALPYRPCPRHRRTNEPTNVRTNEPTVSSTYRSSSLSPNAVPHLFPSWLCFFFSFLSFYVPPLCSHTTDTQKPLHVVWCGYNGEEMVHVAVQRAPDRLPVTAVNFGFRRRYATRAYKPARPMPDRTPICETRAPGGRRGAPPRPPPVSPALEEAGPPERERERTRRFLSILSRVLSVLSRYVARSLARPLHISLPVERRLACPELLRLVAGTRYTPQPMLLDNRRRR